jgi:hypothetical protein
LSNGNDNVIPESVSQRSQIYIHFNPALRDSSVDEWQVKSRIAFAVSGFDKCKRKSKERTVLGCVVRSMTGILMQLGEGVVSGG